MLCSAVILLYDYILTLPLELSQIWNGKVTLMKAAFFINRYIGTYYIYGFIFLDFVKPATNIECLALYFFIGVSSALGAVSSSTIFTLRTFAIYGRGWTVFYLLTVPAIGVVASNIWITIIEPASAFPTQVQVGPFTCGYDVSVSTFAASFFNIVSLAVFDVLVVMFTVYRTGRLAIESRKADIKGSLSYILLRDGIFYYLAIFIPTFANVALNAIALKTENLIVITVSSDFFILTDALQAVIVNRLVLNLSQTANAREDLEYRTRTGIDPPMFAVNTVLGNAGALVSSFPYGYHDEEVEGEGKQFSALETVARNTDTEAQPETYEMLRNHRFNIAEDNDVSLVHVGIQLCPPTVSNI